MKPLDLSRQRACRRRSWIWAAVALFLVLVCVSGPALASSGGEAEHTGSHGGFGKNDWFRIMNFTVLFVVLFLLLRKPIPKALNGRIQGIKDQLNDLEARKAEAEKQLAAYNQKLSTLETEAESILADYVRQGEEAKARILKEAEAASEKLQAQASRNIEHEFELVKSRLQQEILKTSLEKAEALIKSKISAQDQERLVEEYLQKVVAS
jgi:F-type H+-transporting ATPase subunit b